MYPTSSATSSSKQSKQLNWTKDCRRCPPEGESSEGGKAVTRRAGAGDKAGTARAPSRGHPRHRLQMSHPSRGEPRVSIKEFRRGGARTPEGSRDARGVAAVYFSFNLNGSLQFGNNYQTFKRIFKRKCYHYGRQIYMLA